MSFPLCPYIPIIFMLFDYMPWSNLMEREKREPTINQQSRLDVLAWFGRE